MICTYFYFSLLQNFPQYLSSDVVVFKPTIDIFSLVPKGSLVKPTKTSRLYITNFCRVIHGHFAVVMMPRTMQLSQQIRVSQTRRMCG